MRFKFWICDFRFWIVGLALLLLSAPAFAQRDTLRTSEALKATVIRNPPPSSSPATRGRKEAGVKSENKTEAVRARESLEIETRKHEVKK